MSEQELDEAAYLLLQKVKIAIATIIIKSTPENLTVKQYAAIFQDKFRKHHANRVNLHLEKRNFHERLLLLLPAFRTSTSQGSEFCEPMDVDVEETIPATELQPKYYDWGNENDRFYTNLIESMSRFLDAVMRAEVLASSSEMITRNNIVELLLICDKSDPTYFNEETNQCYSSISSSLLKYVMKSVDVTRIISECVSTIVHLVRKYLRILNTKFVNRKSVMAVKYANEVLLKCSRNFSQNDQVTEFVTEFVKTSTQDFFVLSSSQSACHCWYVMFGCWRQSESICAAEINALFGVIEKLTESNPPFMQRLPAENYENILEVLRKMLSSYSKCWLETRSGALKNRSSENEDSYSQQYAELQRSDINCWEKMMRSVILDRIAKKQPVIQTSWTCLKIIVLLKCRLKAINWAPLPTESMTMFF